MPSHRKLAIVALLLLAGAFAVQPWWTAAAWASATAGRPCPVALLDAAQARVVRLIGSDVEADPIWNCSATAVSHGSTAFAVGLPSIVTLGPQGMNVDVAAHELVHAELAARMGVAKRTWVVPVWFDEGLAMQVDHRAAYSRAALRTYLADLAIPKLSALQTRAGFYRAGTEGRLNYAFARCVVAAWSESRNGQRLDAWLQGLRWHEPFPAEQFTQAAERCGRR